MRSFTYALSATSILLGAFLLFVIQPIQGKLLLPYFGGSSSVWATSLLFFTSALFLGYLYVYGLAKLPHRIQPIVHAVLIGVALLFVLVRYFVFPNTPFFWEGHAPSLMVLVALVASIGVPYFLLATTGPLIQYWYGTISGKEPYALYSFSNAASLLALLSYPFLIEPLIPLRLQGNAWALLFGFYALFYVASAYRFFTHGKKESSKKEKSSGTRISLARRSLWVSLASLPAFMLVATTTHITQAIAPVPLLWIVPLLLYLLTFILAFRGSGQSLLTPLFFLLTVFAAFWFMPARHIDIVPQVLSYLGVLFFCGLVCHVLLYRMRPKTEHSPLFYVLLSLGGALGTLAASVIPPLIFPDFWEFPIGLAMCGALAIVLLPSAFFPRALDAHRIVIAKMVLCFAAATFFTGSFVGGVWVPSIETRNFYGNATVVFNPGTISLMHGTTLHGMQFTDSSEALLPVTYYTPSSGVGRAILFAQDERGSAGTRVGVIGLGTGSIAAYCRAEDTYVFYEIDERIERIARSYFSYLPRCAHGEVRVGDGRLILERELKAGNSGTYDILAVDAFSDDTIPVHLLTREAFETYVAHLRSEKSIIAVHISNRYLDLAPVIFRLAAELRLSAMVVRDAGEASMGGSSSAWMLLVKDAGVLRSTVFANTNSLLPIPSKEVWTDDYSSLLPVLNIPLP